MNKNTKILQQQQTETKLYRESKKKMEKNIVDRLLFYVVRRKLQNVFDST